MNGVPEPGRGAYGLRLTGLAEPSGLHEAVRGAPVVRVEFVSTHPIPTGQRIEDDQRFEDSLATGHVLVADRAATSTRILGPEVGPAEQTHPFLAQVARVHNRWLGRACLHGGVFEVDGRAWIVLGAREAGKSSLLAELARRGVPVLADDLAVVDTHGTPTVFAGPTSVDLRSALPGDHQELTPVRGGTRLRLTVPPSSWSAVLGGWILPRWAGQLCLTRLSASQLLPRLAQAQRDRPPALWDPLQLLELAARPGWAWERPRSWSSAQAAVDALLDAVSSAPAAPRSGPVR